MLFRNYSNRHLSYGHLSRKKQRWDASTNYDSISTEDEDSSSSVEMESMRTTTNKKTQQIVEELQSNGIADVSQTNGVVEALLRIILTKNLAVTLVKFLSVWIMMARRRRAMTSSVFRLNASCLQ